MSRTTIQVQAQHLRVGDQLQPTNRIVTHAPSAGVRTPTGKTDVGIDGYRRTWGKYTKITVSREQPDA